MSSSTVSLASADVAEYYSEQSVALRLLHFLKKQRFLRAGSEPLTDKNGKFIRDDSGKVRFRFLHTARICVGPAASQIYYSTSSLPDMLSLFKRLAESGVISRASSSSPYRTPKFGWCFHCNSAAEKFPHNYQAHGMCFSSKRQADLYEEREEEKLADELANGFEFDLHGNRIGEETEDMENEPTLKASAPEFVSRDVAPIYTYVSHPGLSSMLINTPMGPMWCLVPVQTCPVVHYH